MIEKVSENHTFWWKSQGFFCQIFTKMRDFHEKGQATIIIPIRPISESDKCQLRGRWWAVSSWKCYVHSIYSTGPDGSVGGKEPLFFAKLILNFNFNLVERWDGYILTLTHISCTSFSISCTSLSISCASFSISCTSFRKSMTMTSKRK